MTYVFLIFQLILNTQAKTIDSHAVDQFIERKILEESKLEESLSSHLNEYNLDTQTKKKLIRSNNRHIKRIRSKRGLFGATRNHPNTESPGMQT